MPGLDIGPPAGNGDELQFALASFEVPELAGSNLVFEVLGGFEQCGFECVISGLSVQGRAVGEQRRFARVAGGLGVQARPGNLQADLDPEGRFSFFLVFEDHFGSGDRETAVQVIQLFPGQAPPNGLGCEIEVSKGSFYFTQFIHHLCRSICFRIVVGWRPARQPTVFHHQLFWAISRVMLLTTLFTP